MRTLRFPSIPQNITLVENFVEELREAHNIGDDAFGNILISLTEAANNAIMHGNKKDPSKEVIITSEVDGRGKNLTFVVKDQGLGFNHNDLPDPTAPENLEKTSGRGVFLIMQLADMVIFSDKGRSVEMQFRI